VAVREGQPARCNSCGDTIIATSVDSEAIAVEVEMETDAARPRSKPRKKLVAPKKASKASNDLVPIAITLGIGALFIFPPFLFPKVALLSALVGFGISLYAFIRMCNMAGKLGNYVSFDYLEALGPIRFVIAVGFLGLYLAGYFVLWYVVLFRCLFDKPRSFLPWMALQGYGPFVTVAAVAVAGIGDAWGPNRYRGPDNFQNMAAAQPFQDPTSRPGGPQFTNVGKDPVRQLDDNPPRATPVEKERPAPPVKKEKPIPELTANPRLNAILADLDDRPTCKAACEKLAAMEPNRYQSVVARKLAERLAASELWLRTPLCRALAVWATPEQVPTLITMLDDPDINTRNEVLDVLGKLRDPRSVKAVVRCYLPIQTRWHGERALWELGPLAEKEVLKLLDDKDRNVRADACRMLEKIGTRESVPALRAASAQGDFILKVAADNALRAIQARKK
jgi:hypothetical protein